MSKPQQRIHIVGLVSEEARVSVPGLLPMLQLDLRDGEQSQRIHIIGMNLDGMRERPRRAIDIHQLVLGDSDLIIEVRQCGIGVLRLEQPAQALLIIPGAG